MRSSKGYVFEKGSNKSKLVFNYFREEETGPNENFGLKARFVEPSGQEVFSEKLEAVGYKPVKYSYSQPNVGEAGSIEVVGNKLIISYTKGGKTKTSEEKVTEDLVVGPTLFPFVQAHWSQLSTGKEVGLRMGVIDRRETIGFKLAKVSEFERDGTKYVRLSMKASNPFIAMLVVPIFINVEKDTGRVRETEGTTLIRMEKNGQLDNLSAEMIFD